MIVLMTLILFSVIGLSILTFSTFTMKTMANERDDQTVYYIAESGLVEKRVMLISEIDRIYNLSIKDYEQQLLTPSPQPFKEIFLENLLNFMVPEALESNTYTHYESQFLKKPEASIKVDVLQQGDYRIYTLTSTGRIDNQSRTVSQNIVVDLNSAYNRTISADVSRFSIYARNKITLGNNDILHNVKGELASATQTNIQLANGEHKEITYDPVNFDILVNTIYKNRLTFDSTLFENTTYTPNYSTLIRNNKLEATWNTHHNKTLTLSGNLKLDEMSIGNNMTFTIDVGNSDKILYVNALSLAANFQIIGSGSLTIYVKDRLQLNYSNININGETDKLKIYYAGDSKITIASGLQLNADLYVKNADLQISGEAGFYGDLYSNGTGTLTIDGGSINKDVLMVTPNYDILLTGGAMLKGTLLCSNIHITGGASVDRAAGGGLQNTYTIEKTNPITSHPIIET